MIHGGRIHEATGAWLVRCRNLRAGDRIETRDWNGAYWCHGEALVVTAPPETTGLGDGFYDLWVYSEDCPSEVRSLCIRPDDEIKIAGRLEKKIENVQDGDKKRKKRPKKGQLDLF